MEGRTQHTIYLFTDGSVHPQSAVGYGAWLFVEDLEQPAEDLKTEVQTQRFEDTSSTKLEIQTLLWALKQITPSDIQIIVYTDSQNLVGLLERRTKLEAKNYQSKNREQIKNADLYKEFYKLYDLLSFELRKVKGHKQTKNKTAIYHLFTLVDRASREALRKLK